MWWRTFYHRQTAAQDAEYQTKDNFIIAAKRYLKMGGLGKNKYQQRSGVDACAWDARFNKNLMSAMATAGQGHSRYRQTADDTT